MPDHTPGPWEAEDVRTENRHVYWRINAPGYRHHVGFAEGDQRGLAGIYGERENEANARLIAAAPDLLDACLAGGRYLDAIKVLQEAGLRGKVVSVDTTSELERLLRDWHDKAHAVLDRLGVKP